MKSFTLKQLANFENKTKEQKIQQIDRLNINSLSLDHIQEMQLILTSAKKPQSIQMLQKMISKRKEHLLQAQRRVEQQRRNTFIDQMQNSKFQEAVRKQKQEQKHNSLKLRYQYDNKILNKMISLIIFLILVGFTLTIICNSSTIFPSVQQLIKNETNDKLQEGKSDTNEPNLDDKIRCKNLQLVKGDKQQQKQITYFGKIILSCSLGLIAVLVLIALLRIEYKLYHQLFKPLTVLP